MKNVLLIQILFHICCSVKVFGQDISSFKGAKPLVVSGSIYGSANYSTLQNNGLDPFGYNAGILLNFKFYNNINIPVSYQMSNYSSSFDHFRLNRFGISPSYKNFKIHGGYRSYQLSPYVMTGMTILGGGMEWSPKKFYLLAFYGTVADRYNAGNEFLSLRLDNALLYSRRAYGLKLGFGKQSNRFSIMAYHAGDDENTGTIDSLSKYNVRAVENLVIGADMQQTFFKNIVLSFNGALNLLTKDKNGSAIEDSNAVQWIERASPLLTINATTRHSFAYDGRISFRIKTFNLGIKYQHIDPYYTSLGVPFLQNNFDNYLIDMNGALFKAKVVLTANAGIQQMNKGGNTGLPQKRWVANVNANINLSKNLNLGGNFSNLVQNTNLQVEEVADSLAVTVNNTGWSGNVSFKPGSGKVRPHGFSLSTSGNNFDIVHADTISASTQNFNTSFNYKYSLKNHWNFGVGILYNTSDNPSAQSTKRYGLQANAGKELVSGLQFRSSGTYRLNATDGVKDGYVINGSFGLTYHYKKKHQLGLNINQLVRNTSKLASKQETRFRVNYNYSF